MRTFVVPRGGLVRGLSFSPRGGQLLVVFAQHRGPPAVAQWTDLGDGSAARTLDLPGDRFAVSADHARLVAAAPRPLGTVRREVNPEPPLWWCDVGPAAPEWVPVPVLPPGVMRRGAAAEFTPDGAGLVAVASWWGGHRLTRWTLAPTDEVWAYTDTGPVWDLVAVSPDGTRVAVSGGPAGMSYVARWDAGGQCLTGFQPPGEANTLALAFGPDNTLAAANGRQIYLFPPDDQEPRLALRGHAQPVNVLAFTPDGGRLLSGSNDHHVRVWDAATGACAAALDWKLGQVMSLAVAHDGLTAAAAGKGSKVVVWDLEG